MKNVLKHVFSQILFCSTNNYYTLKSIDSNAQLFDYLQDISGTSPICTWTRHTQWRAMPRKVSIRLTHCITARPPLLLLFFIWAVCYCKLIRWLLVVCSPRWTSPGYRCQIMAQHAALWLKNENEMQFSDGHGRPEWKIHSHMNVANKFQLVNTNTQRSTHIRPHGTKINFPRRCRGYSCARVFVCGYAVSSLRFCQNLSLRSVVMIVSHSLYIFLGERGKSGQHSTRTRASATISHYTSTVFALSVITASTGSRELPFICVSTVRARERAPVRVWVYAVEWSPLRRVY